MADELSYASEAYLAAKSLWTGRKYSPHARRRASSGGSVPYARGRDPRVLGDVLSSIARDFGWTAELSRTSLVTEWAALVGQDIAEHTEVVSIEGTILHVQCDSTAWATQLRRMRHQIVTKIIQEYPDSGVEDILFKGPHTPSWRHGFRTVPGRGPRDTYG